MVLILVGVCSSVTWGQSVHILRKNETLYSIARKYGIPVDDLIKMNNIQNVHNLRVGTEIIIRPETSETHRARKGETLFGIARQYDITLDELLSANKIDRGYLLKVDDVLKIPGTGTETSAATVVYETTEQEQEPVPEAETEAAAVSRDLAGKDWPIIGVPVPSDGKLSGVYIKGSRGDPVRTISSGTVVWVGPYRGFGKVVLIQSFDRYVYVYGGNDEIEVEVGQEVTPGMVISKLGTNPHSQEPELFFSVFRHGKPVDPEQAPRS